MNLLDIADLIHAEVYDPSSTAQSMNIATISPLDKAAENHISFLTNPRFAEKLADSRAGAFITKVRLESINKPQLVHANPYWAMAKVAGVFYKYQHHFFGISPLAHIHPEAKIAADATIYPFAYIAAGAMIGEHSVIYPHTYIGENSRIGKGCVLFPGTVVMDHMVIGDEVIIHSNAVIGGDGFGFAPGKDDIAKIPQMGNVKIGNHVEIGALSNIDRATFQSTEIGEGAKLDSLVHIAHNVKVGKNSMICAQSAIAGSSSVGERTVMAGQSAVAPGLVIGNNITLGGRCALIEDLDTPGEYLGMPPLPSRQWLRNMGLIQRLPQILQRLANLEKTNQEPAAADKKQAG